MAYVPVPKDLSNIKSKVAFNLTKRQLICLGGGAIIGIPLFFLLRPITGNTAAAMGMILVMLPAFMFGMYEKQGQPLEVALKQMIQVLFIRPKYRPYETNNFYEAVIKQADYDKEVRRILNGNKTNKKTKPSDSRRSAKSREKR